MELGFTLQAGQPARYNVGVFVGNQGKDINLAGAAGATAVARLPPSRRRTMDFSTWTTTPAATCRIGNSCTRG